jgi:type I restriction enzyme S subunit
VVSGQVKEVSIQYQVSRDSCDTEDSMGGQGCPRGYKQTEVGVVPNDWEVLPLSNLTVLMTNGFVGTAKTHYTDSHEGVLYIQGYNVEENSFNFKGIKKVTPEFHKRQSKSCLREGDVLMVQTGDVGLTTIVSKELVGANCHALIILRFKLQALDPQYFSYYLNSKDGRNRLKDLEVGTTMKHINVGNLLHFPVPVPSSKTEQTAIAKALSDVDALITSLEKLITKKRAIKTAAMQQLLTGKKRLPPFDLTHTGYKQTELGEIPEDWKVDILEKMSAFITKGSTPTTYGFSWEKDGVLFLRSECVSERGLDLYESMYISEKAHRVLKRSEVRSGDILITITGNVGRLIYLDEKVAEGNINQHIARVRITSENINSTYVFHYLSQKAVRKYFQSITTGQAYPQISLTQVRNTEIPYPSLKEQTAIANVLSDMDKEIDALAQRLNKTQQLKQGMMQELLTGRTRLI